MKEALQVPHPIEVLYGQGVSLACSPAGEIWSDQLHGLFAGDTRLLSTYRLAVEGAPWRLLSREREDESSARWRFQNPAIRGPAGALAEGVLLLTLTRRVSAVLKEELELVSFVGVPLRLRFTLHIDGDFADIFQVRDQTIPPRLNLQRRLQEDGLTMGYEKQGFRRALRIRFFPAFSRPVFVGTLVVFELELSARGRWSCRIEAEPVIDGKCAEAGGRQPSAPPGPEIESGPLLERPFRRGQADLRALIVPQRDKLPYIAAGVPWFFTLFCRDTLVSSLMAGLDGAWAAQGALAALGERQARERDDWRDAEPGKLPHEVRRGELAYRNAIPHSAYYGTHDAQALYCLALWQAWRWTGDPELLDRHWETAWAALRWCEQYGDRDGDGLQEYGTRSREGYYNQGWKDAGDAIVHPDGSIAGLPLATVELQGYLFAALLAMAELLEERARADEAGGLREKAQALRAAVEQRFWMEDEAFYALALDGSKRPVKSIASNPAHLLWCGLPSTDRAHAAARRFLEPDMFSGWGLRTISAKNAAYNPLSYQLGSVWPFDTALAAAGLWRYGEREIAKELLRAILEAAAAFEHNRLPELFSGVERGVGLPVPYARANNPQAWSAAVPILAATLFLGLVPDAPRGRCFLAPDLPEWLPRLKLRGIPLGRGTLDVHISRRGNETIIDALDPHGIEVILGPARAPLWGERFHA